MNELREWAGMLCAAAMLCTVLLQLLPSGGASPLMRVVLGLFFCCCLFGPLRSLVTTDWRVVLPMSESSVSEEQLLETYHDAIRQQTDAALRQTVDALLSDTAYRVEKISARWTESEDGSIYLTGADAYLSREQTAHTQEIARLLAKELEIRVTVHPYLGR